MSTSRFPRLHGPAWVALLAGLAATLSGLVLSNRFELSESQELWLGTASALVITGLVFWLLQSRIDSGARARARAAELIRELRDSEMRLNFAVTGSGLGVWDWDLPSNRIFYSRRWKQMLGYEEAEIGDRPEDWENLVHPEERDEVVAQCNDCVEGRLDSYDAQYRMRCRDGEYIWVRDRGMVSVRDGGGRALRMIGTLSDVNGQMTALLRLRLLARMHAAFSEGTAAVVQCETPEALFRRICEVVVEHGGVRMAWVGLTDPETREVRPVCAFGQGTAYLDGLQVSACPDSPYSHGPCGTAIRENRPVWVQDFRTDPRTALWQERALQYGWGSAAAIPIVRGGRVVGALNLYSPEVGWYQQEIRSLLENLAAQIGFALDRLAASAPVRNAA